MNQETDPHQTLESAGALSLETPASRNVRNKCLLSEPPHLWYRWNRLNRGGQFPFNFMCNCTRFREPDSFSTDDVILTRACLLISRQAHDFLV